MQAAWTAFAANPSTGLSSVPFKLPLYKPTVSLSPTLIRLAYKEEIAPSMAYPLEYDWICYLVDLIPVPTGLRRRVERIRHGRDVETVLQEMSAEEVAEVVSWAGRVLEIGCNTRL